MKNVIMILATVYLSLFGLTACNTIEGMGKDIKSAGEAIEEEAAD